MNPLWRWLAPLLIILVVGGGLVGKVVIDNREDNVLCEAVNANRSTVRNLVLSARNQIPKEDTKRNRKSRRFFQRELNKIVPLDCSHFNRDSLKRLTEGGDSQPKDKKTSKQPP